MKKIGTALNNLFFWAALVIFVLLVAFIALGKSTEDIYVFGYKPFIIATGSMETEYMTHSLVVIHKGGFDDVEIGDVVAFRAASKSQKLAFHRVVSQVDGAFVTKGDNNSQVDGTLVTRNNFIGREVFHSNITAYWAQELQKPFGWVRMILVPILAIVMFCVGIYILNRWTTNKNLRRLVICGVLLAASIVALISYYVWDSQRIDYTNQKLVEVANVFVAQNEDAITTINNREIIGVVEIEKINVKYPIIAYENDSSLDISIVKYSGPALNETGNVVLLGHRSANGGNLFFTRIDHLVSGDTVKVTDKTGRTVNYKVVEYNIHTPYDLSVLEAEKSGAKELTLISCTSNLLDRYVVKLVKQD